MILYRIVASLLAPVLSVMFLVWLLRGQERLTDIVERLGGGHGGPGAIWIHGASNGELTSAKTLIFSLLKAFPESDIVVTANTVTGRALIKSWGMHRVTGRLAAVDLRWALARFRRIWQPKALIILENELWPNRIDTASEPVLCIAARMSARSAARWSRASGFAKRLMKAVSYLTAQDGASAQRFVTLGLEQESLGPETTLKTSVSIAAPDANVLRALQRVFVRTETLLAASTHEGEEQIVLDAFLKAYAKRPELKLILAPRHPKRCKEIARLVEKTTLPFAIRSEIAIPAKDVVIYLADTLGEMAMWYSLAGMAFVGGSLVSRGGHTPFEPTQFGSAILHGPYLENFAGPYALLTKNKAAQQVTDAGEFAEVVSQLHEEEQIAMARRAQSALKADAPDFEHIVEALRILAPDLT